MLVQLGLCRTCTETTLLVFPRGGSYFNKCNSVNMAIAKPRKAGGKRTVCLSVCGLSVVIVVLLIIVIYLATKQHPCETGKTSNCCFVQKASSGYLFKGTDRNCLLTTRISKEFVGIITKTCPCNIQRFLRL